MANTIACSLIGSRLDYCNSLLNGTSTANIDKLQRVQNNLSRIVLGKPRRTPSHELRKTLHWLPIASRLQYKTALITFKALGTGQPSYLAELLSVQHTARQTRASSDSQLHQPLAKSQMAGRGFRYQAPAIWNGLPKEMKAISTLNCFKSQLKTHYFKAAYDC